MGLAVEGGGGEGLRESSSSCLSSSWTSILQGFLLSISWDFKNSWKNNEIRFTASLDSRTVGPAIAYWKLI